MRVFKREFKLMLEVKDSFHMVVMRKDHRFLVRVSFTMSLFQAGDDSLKTRGSLV